MSRYDDGSAKKAGLLAGSMRAGVPEKVIAHALASAVTILSTQTLTSITCDRPLHTGLTAAVIKEEVSRLDINYNTIRCIDYPDVDKGLLLLPAT